MKIDTRIIILWIILLCLFLYFYYNVYIRPYEYFENEIKQEKETIVQKKERLEKELKEFLTFLNTQMCPAIQEIQKSLKEDPNVNSEEKIKKDAGGEIYDCTYVNDPTRIPASIDMVLRRTIPYLSLTLASIQKNIDNSLQCKMPGTTEGFESSSPFLCTPALMEERKKKQQENDAARCIPPENLKEDQIITLYETRLKTLKTFFEDKTIQEQLSSINTTLQKIQETKKKMEDGTLRPQCDNGNDDAPEPMP